jgi:hypothetical protein
MMKKLLLLGGLAVLLLAGCASQRPCMTGFELGVNAGRFESPDEFGDSTYGGVHGTVYFDTTGACQALR